MNTLTGNEMGNCREDTSPVSSSHLSPSPEGGGKVGNRRSGIPIATGNGNGKREGLETDTWESDGGKVTEGDLDRNNRDKLAAHPSRARVCPWCGEEHRPGSIRVLKDGRSVCLVDTGAIRAALDGPDPLDREHEVPLFVTREDREFWIVTGACTLIVAAAGLGWWWLA